MAESSEARQHSPAAERNAGPILAVLRRYLPDRGRIVEIAAGTGQHATRFAAAFPRVDWQPCDIDPKALASIRAWRAEAGTPNLAEPLELDVHWRSWPIAQADGLVCINLLHIAPWTATQGLFDGASHLLPAGAPLLIYGPFRVDGTHVAESNASFDADLQRRDPSWGVRDLEAVAEVARANGFETIETVVMPANNRMLAFRRQS